MLDSWGMCGTGEIPQERLRRGSSPPAPPESKCPERKSMDFYSQLSKNDKSHREVASRWLLSTLLNNP
ncbi:hypothetical protein FA727_19815 [Robertmurraya kyonggiensis]|uniref:Uncharacterized protein n=1 Tax=Robertmurraya kyonggiensis TaxID=1037680 RepID=A0A4U1CYN3_9BACI|nr:hypothetical protein FA727_19815 [Robertmurraya kyonggiensis]